LYQGLQRLNGFVLQKQNAEQNEPTVASSGGATRVDLIVREIATGLGSASEDRSIGTAVHALAQHFGMTDVIISDVAKAKLGHDDAVLFSSTPLPRLSLETLLTHPIARRALTARGPISLAEVLASMGVGPSALPRSLRGRNALSVNVDQDSTVPINVLFSGKEGKVDGLSRSMMCLAAQMAAERRCQVKSNPPKDNPLTDREAEAMRMLVQGKTDAEIAQAMNIAARTVRFHIANAKAKLGVTSRAQAIVTSLRSSGR
jgi:DNA-binding CsgD family transcriptional regulator